MSRPRRGHTPAPLWTPSPLSSDQTGPGFSQEGGREEEKEGQLKVVESRKLGRIRRA